MIRMSGLVSGLDTESIVSQLMAAQKTKKTKIENKKTKLEWQEEKWKDLNTKLYKLYTDSVSKMRLQSSYKSKTVTSSNESKLTATASSSAPTGSNIVTVDKLASSQYVTGANISSLGLKGSSKLTKIVDSNGNSIASGTIITITAGTGDSSKTNSFAVDDNTTVTDFVNALKDAGLNANFDEKQGRFFISSSESGAKNAFTISAGTLTADAMSARKAIEDALGYSSLSSTDKNTVRNAYKTISEGNYKESYDAVNSLLDIMEKNTKTSVEKSATDYVKSMAKKSITDDTALMDEIRKKQEEAVTDSSVESAVKQKYKTEATKEITAQLDKEIKDGTIVLEDQSQREVLLKERLDANLDKMVQDKVDDKTQYEADLASTKEEKIQKLVDEEVDSRVKTQVATTNAKKQIEYFVNNGLSKDSVNKAVKDGILTEEQAGLVEVNDDNAFDSVDAQVTVAKENLSKLIDDYKAIGNTQTSGSGALGILGLGQITGAAMSGGDKGMTVIEAQDSQVTLNGAVITGTTNNFTANGITFNLKSVTAPGESVTINVTNDVDATYKMVKDFISSYNDILKEMNTLYYASSARGYEPLTDDEREAMTDDQIEKWETKIKDSLFRGDSTLGSIINSMKNAMASGVEVDGKTYSLSTYGIMTSTDYSEKGLLHIYGNADDATYSSKTDKLKAALEDDPDTVIQVLTGVAGKLYNTMADKMKTSSTSSALTFYNDKQITKQLKQYKTDISDWDEKLQDMEDRYYKQFAAMEKALSNLNSQTASLSSLFGTSS